MSIIKRINLSNFNNNKVFDMSYMFDKCSSLKELNLSNFNTNIVLDKAYLFAGMFKNKKNYIFPI